MLLRRLNHCCWRYIGNIQNAQCLHPFPTRVARLVVVSAKGRGEEARNILIKYHAEGDADSEFVKAEYAQIEQTLEMELEQTKMSWKDMVKTSGMRKRLLIGSFLGLVTQWSGNGLTSYFLARILDNVGIHDNHTKNLINLANTCWGFLNATAFALTVARFKRRTIYLICSTSILLIFVGWTIASAQYEMTQSQGSSRAVIAFIFLYSPAYNIAYNALTYTYLVEIFPFHVRAKGISVFQWFSRAAGFFNQFVNPIGIANAGWKYYISYCVWIAFEVVFIWFLFPETSGRTLEELAFLYEDDARKEQEQRVDNEVADEGISESDSTTKPDANHVETVPR
ncbi:hypothetical protein ONZ45_g13221 [Pleurotus djamor]|nr:hypothetical protein ONZ45_g13221 [Pleurotus djamor]